MSHHYDLVESCFEATTWIDRFDRADVAWVVDVVLDWVIEALRKDPTIPDRALTAWDLFFADARRRAEDVLADELEDRAKLGEVIDAIADHFAEEETGGAVITTPSTNGAPPAEPQL